VLLLRQSKVRTTGPMAVADNKLAYVFVYHI